MSVGMCGVYVMRVSVACVCVCRYQLSESQVPLKSCHLAALCSGWNSRTCFQLWVSVSDGGTACLPTSGPVASV